MKTCTPLVSGLFALASFPLWAQQPPPANQSDTPAAQQSPSSTAPAPPNSSSVSPGAPAAQMSPVNGELVSKLDSKTAKNGDSVVVQTKTPVKTPDGTEIPKGSKLVGHVLAVQPSQPGQNAQLALQFDRVELKGGKTMPVHSQIESISPPDGAASASGISSPGGGAASGSQTGGSANPSTSRAANDGSNASSAAPGAGSAASGSPAPGTVVAKTGQIAISTTSIPGVLVANNAPGQQDPRMADASSILLGARKDILLDGGTLIVVGVSPSGAGAQ
ncbi:MAG: hypothetical protein QOJ42_403 [Acidobacteriaceae bacterium]|jgi:hypothetical protein|nr:hypothetical protein [Acidobacteriaceae bacterium]